MTAAVRVKNFTIQQYEIKSICRAAPPECEGAFPVERSERNLLRPRAEQSMEETLLTKITKQLYLIHFLEAKTAADALRAMMGTVRLE